jgi:hypothetical protein
LLYVVPSQPHTGAMIVGQSAGTGAQRPSACGSQVPFGLSQN